MAKKKEAKVVAPEEHAVKTEQEKLKEMLFMWHALVLHAICISPTQESEHPF